MTDIPSPQTCIAFNGPTHLATGTPGEVALAVKAALAAVVAQQIQVFDTVTSRPVDFDLRGSDAEILARLAPVSATETEQPAAKPGRPKLGVVAREVTLLPRHWDWLAAQPGGASVTLRKLVEAAKRAETSGGDRRVAQESAYRFMSATVGNEPGFEEATRALFAGDADRFAAFSENWPTDLRDHSRLLAARAFAEA